MAGLKSLSTLSIARSFALISFLAGLILIGSLGYTLLEARSEMLDLKRAEIRHSVEAAASIINGYVARAEKGELSDADARRQAVTALQAARFDDGNYYFVYDFKGVGVMHPNKEVIGADRSSVQDVKGKFYLRDFIEIARKGGGFVDYLWVRPGDKDPTLKISYVAPIQRWQWFVGAGLHVHQVDGIFLTMVRDLAAVLVPVALLLLGLAVLLGRRVSKLLNSLGSSMESLAEGRLETEIAGLGRSDEIGRMARSVQTFKQGALEKARLEAESVEQRDLTESERRRNETQRARAVQEQEAVVHAIASGLERLSSGDLTYRIEEALAPEYKKLKDDFNAAMAQLQETMTVVLGNTQSIKSGTGEISHAADDLSRRTEQQAASLEETAAALDQITATVRKTADGARQARQVVSSAKSDAGQSGTIVRDAVEAMGGIEKSAQEISQIIGVIDEIAFQTNLLALNAGVEAARAGEAGRGFAVVASEVRALAQRSAEAAKEIKTLISASSAQVERGVDLVGQTGKVLERITQQVMEIDGVVGEIAASAEEQATGLGQVNVAVNQMDQVTQQNAAMVEQSTAASHSLAQEADQLAQLMARFRTGQVVAMPAPQERKAERKAAAPARAASAAPAYAGNTALKLDTARREESWEEF